MSSFMNYVTLSNNQFGFRKQRSTTHAMKKLVEIYENNKKVPYDKGKMLCIIGIDIRNAFNSLRWKDIIRELKTKKQKKNL